MNECFFCKTIGRPEFEPIYESTFFYAYLSDLPINPGHIELFPKRHIPSVMELTSDEQADLIPTITRVQDILMTYDLKNFYENQAKDGDRRYNHYYVKRMIELPYLGITPTGFNIGINQGVSAGQTVMHLHIHIVPRYDGDVAEPAGGIRNYLNDLGNYKKHL